MSKFFSWFGKNKDQAPEQDAPTSAAENAEQQSTAAVPQAEPTDTTSVPAPSATAPVSQTETPPH
ncbi:hypothetical protein ACFQMB_16430 [Pseudobowmanella zhangzhouensis]|uniref:hypothetical protein n=1 Tax=Pseudobowmanella zhangzhouensis TaxID=1537679 RepID=UPI00360B1A8C